MSLPGHEGCAEPSCIPRLFHGLVAAVCPVRAQKGGVSNGFGL